MMHRLTTISLKRLLFTALLGVSCALVPTERVLAKSELDYCTALATPNYDWAETSLNLESFEDQFIYLVDGTGLVYKGLKNLNEGAESYIDSFFSAGRFPAWLNDSYRKNLAANSGSESLIKRSAPTIMTPVFYYGLSQTISQNWMSNYIHFVITDLRNLIQSFSRRRLPYSSYGVTSISNSMLLHRLYRCNHAVESKNHFFKSLFIVNVTDNGTNFNPNLGLGELREIQRKNPDISGVDALYAQLQSNKQLYNITPISSSLFESGKSGYQEDLAYRLDDQCKNDCEYSLSASLTKVTPALPVDTSQFYAVEQVPEFKYVHDGYHLTLSVKELKAQFDNYRLKSLCVTPKPTESFEAQWQCYVSGQEWHFDWRLNVTDMSQNQVIKPQQLHIRSLYHYSPEGHDLGLMVERQQAMNVSYQSAGELVNGAPVLRSLLKSHPGQSLDWVKQTENEKIERGRIIQNLIKQGLVAATAVLCVVGIWGLVAFLNRRFKQPILLLRIHSQSKLSVDDASDRSGEHGPVALTTLHHALDETLSFKPETLSGYLELINESGPNKEGAWEHIKVNELGIKIHRIVPETVTCDAPLLISNQAILRNIALREPEVWPIIFDIKRLANIEDSEFPNATITLYGEVYLQAESSKGKSLTATSCLFTLNVQLNPATYEFEANLMHASLAYGQTELESL